MLKWKFGASSFAHEENSSISEITEIMHFVFFWQESYGCRENALL